MSVSDQIDMSALQSHQSDRCFQRMRLMTAYRTKFFTMNNVNRLRILHNAIDRHLTCMSRQQLTLLMGRVFRYNLYCSSRQSFSSIKSIPLIVEIWSSIGRYCSKNHQPTWLLLLTSQLIITGEGLVNGNMRQGCENSKISRP